ncbi:hypothetical protein [Pseudonocardia alni]|uniref:hypothetical protein n=1 Tax=Pseudonocardia alni TaxID=33907 RepID=UPI00332A8417
MTERPFADAEVVVLDVLSPVTPTVPVVTATPPNFAPPMVQVQRLGGSDNGITDYPNVAVTCYGADRPSAWAMAEQCRQLVLSAAHTEHADVLVDTASTVTPAAQLPDPRADLAVVTALYRLGMRRPRPST